jgi:hypothetical protein
MTSTTKEQQFPLYNKYILKTPWWWPNRPKHVITFSFLRKKYTQAIQWDHLFFIEWMHVIRSSKYFCYSPEGHRHFLFLTILCSVLVELWIIYWTSFAYVIIPYYPIIPHVMWVPLSPQHGTSSGCGWRDRLQQ